MDAEQKMDRVKLVEERAMQKGERRGTCVYVRVCSCTADDVEASSLVGVAGLR